ncbi:MAG: N-acetylmuramoyl-L-alanine amidase [Acidobacteria bacterium]|nr:N-acetylmuramoyl-L-alanine amidase [Acidobacteriota bacterium]
MKTTLSAGLLCLAAAALLAQQAAPPGAGPTPVVQQALSVVVLDAAHGGTDAGARGESGIVEKDVTLALARVVQAQLERRGFQVVLTRQADESPTFDERAAIANGQRGAVFVSLHIASTGAAGTAMAFYMPAAPTSETKPGPEASGRPLARWQEAQQPYAAPSRKLAELLQVQLGQKLRGSREVPQAVAVRQLRTVAAPAVAVELASVAVADRKPLDQAAPALAEAVARAVAAFKAAYEAGAN